MNKLYLFIIALVWHQALRAQQDPQHTQFMFNKMSYNPAYAGAFESPTLTAIYRKQWIGLEGAPETQVLSYDQRWLNNRIGMGGVLTRNVIGITRNVTLAVPWSYRIPVKRGVLGLAMQVSVRHFYQNWADPRLNPALTIDNAIPNEAQTKYLVNFGTGMYYATQNWYAGFSIPRLLDNNIDFLDLDDEFSREVQHIYLMAGRDFFIDKELKITPQMLLKYAPGAPFDADINVSVMVKRKFFGALGYRLGSDTNGAGESVDVLLGMQATDNLFFCLSYDIGLTRLYKYNSGSIEATVRWWFNPPAWIGDGGPPPPSGD